MTLKSTGYLLAIGLLCLVSCNENSGKNDGSKIYKGVYTFGPEVKSFKDCDSGGEFWVAGNCKPLENKYTQLNFGKPYGPVYVEVEGIKLRSGKEGLGSEFDSTLVVKKLIKIAKEIPQDMCN
jgi:hypothetical protein